MSDRRDKAFGLGGLGISGAAAYLFLVVAGRSLGADQFATLGALWAVVFLATAAIAAPFEIVVAREVASARARGDPLRPLLRAAFVLAGIVGMAVLGTAVLTGGWLDRAVFGGQHGYALGGAIAFAGLAVGAVAKGACAGSVRLAGWGAYLVVDSGVRLGLAVTAAMTGAQGEWFVVALAAGPWLALVVPAIILRREVVGSASQAAIGDGFAALAIATVPLVAGAAAASALTYLGAVILPILVGDPTASVGAYIAALSLARLPLFALSPLVAIAVPRIAYTLESHDPAGTVRVAGLFVGIAAGSGVIVVLLAFNVGNGPLEALFGKGFAVPVGSLAALGTAAACWLLATAATSVAIAAGYGRLSAVAWTAGLAAAIAAAAAFGPDPFARTDAALTIGSVVACVAACASAVVALRDRLTARVVRS